MDKSFQAVVAFYKPVANLTHKQQVMRLYRKYVNDPDHTMCSLRYSVLNSFLPFDPILYLFFNAFHLFCDFVDLFAI